MKASNTTNGSSNRGPSKWTAAVSPVQGYDRSKFYVQAADSRGHGAVLRFVVPEDLEREVKRLVDSGAFPAYEVQSDFIRDAIHHHLRSRQSQVGDVAIQEALHEYAVRRKVKEKSDAMLRASTYWPSQFQATGRVFEVLARDEAWPQLWQLAGEFEVIFDAAPEPYRTEGIALLSDWRNVVPEPFRF